jgi:hypothetical protein
MSASTRFSAFVQSALPIYLDGPRYRLAGRRLGLATAGAVGIALLLQVRPVTNAPVASSDEPRTVAAARPSLSPWRDAWYLDDQFRSVTPAPAIDQLQPPARDRWYEDTRVANGTSGAPAVGDRWYLDAQSGSARGAPQRLMEKDRWYRP